MDENFRFPKSLLKGTRKTMMHPLSRYTTPINPKDERQIVIMAKAGNKRAADRLVLSHYRFVVRVAGLYAKRMKCGIEIEDLISQGFIGLHRAVERFDPDSGLRFMSYAVWWIRQAMINYIREQCLPVRLPSNYFVRAYPGKTEKDREDAVKKNDEHREAIRTIQKSTSVDILTEAGYEFAYDGQATDDGAMTRANQEIVEKLLSELEPIDQFILRQRFGIGSGNGKNLRPIAEALGLSHERVRQREKQAIKKMAKSYERKTA